MKVGKEEVSFRWSNYLKPTPGNLERIAKLVKGILLLGTGSSILSDQNVWLSVGLTFSVGVVDNFTQFFSSVAQEEKQKNDNTPPVA